MVYAGDLTPGMELKVVDAFDPKVYEDEEHYKDAIELYSRYYGRACKFVSVEHHCQRRPENTLIRVDGLDVLFYAGELEYVGPSVELNPCDLSELNNLLAAVIP